MEWFITSVENIDLEDVINIQRVSEAGLFEDKYIVKNVEKVGDNAYKVSVDKYV